MRPDRIVRAGRIGWAAWLVACGGGDAKESHDPGGDSAAESGVDTQPRDTAGDTTGDSTESGRDSTESGRDSGDTGDSGGAWDGRPCSAFGAPVELGRVADPGLTELSGIAVSRANPGIVWVHEDSGGEPVVYALDRAGTLAGSVRLAGVENTDWEDIAVGRCDPGEPERWCVVVGDIGVPGGDRAGFSLLRFEEPVLDGSAEIEVAPEVLPVAYPGEAEDAEGLALTPEGEPVVVTKRADATAGIYRLPAGAAVWEPLAEVSTGAAGEDLTARATAADLSLDGSALLVRTYFHVWLFAAPGGALDLAAPPDPVEVDGAFELQGEAIAWDTEEGGFLQVSEGAGPTLYRVPCR